MFGQANILFSRRPAVVLGRQMVRALAVTGRKSKNVEGKKTKADLAKNKLYARLGTRIVMAAKQGGLDVSKNLELARALKVAKEEKLPKENIDRALKKAEDSSTGGYIHRVYEIFGHGGVGLLASALTDNTNRIFKEVKMVVSRNEAKMAAEGSVSFNFAHKGCIAPTSEYSVDKVLEAAIDADIGDVQFYDPSAHHHAEDEGPTTTAAKTPAHPQHILVAVSDITAMEDALAKVGITGVRSMVYIPTSRVTMPNDETKDLNLKLIDQLENLDEIDAVFHDMEL